jgi:hypothetical protein
MTDLADLLAGDLTAHLGGLAAFVRANPTTAPAFVAAEIDRASATLGALLAEIDRASAIAE